MPTRTARNAKNSVVLNDALVSVSRRGAGRWALWRPSPSAERGRVAPGVVLIGFLLLRWDQKYLLVRFHRDSETRPEQVFCPLPPVAQTRSECLVQKADSAALVAVGVAPQAGRVPAVGQLPELDGPPPGVPVHAGRRRLTRRAPGDEQHRARRDPRHHRHQGARRLHARDAPGGLYLEPG